MVPNRTSMASSTPERVVGRRLVHNDEPRPRVPDPPEDSSTPSPLLPLLPLIPKTSLTVPVPSPATLRHLCVRIYWGPRGLNLSSNEILAANRPSNDWLSLSSSAILRHPDGLSDSSRATLSAISKLALSLLVMIHSTSLSRQFGPQRRRISAWKKRLRWRSAPYSLPQTFRILSEVYHAVPVSESGVVSLILCERRPMVLLPVDFDSRQIVNLDGISTKQLCTSLQYEEQVTRRVVFVSQAIFGAFEYAILTLTSEIGTTPMKTGRYSDQSTCSFLEAYQRKPPKW
ncbi:uncharacterized protein CLUP02_08005 [Colletotrichum lupini]|uniref:Uncharacterized protein n=1 Tax=Colletotrichum lupini TaxID=145971 RepID=A0A9Q8STY6_9PEZI|nr:uncharacterized protein CLUP02_08005 [Colletotrichum lupini]UQC82517.1 hypothetical protein CLUP02_08005 [Colletotrichum lupini]